MTLQLGGISRFRQRSHSIHCMRTSRWSRYCTLLIFGMATSHRFLPAFLAMFGTMALLWKEYVDAFLPALFFPLIS